MHDETHPQHGGTKTLSGMKGRCYNENAAQFKDYDRRGITVCDEWKHDFVAFRDWAMSHGYQEGLSIDRIDPDGNYCSENCRWITMEKKNKRNVKLITYQGETHTLPEWAEICGIEYGTLWSRLKRGKSFEDAIKP